MIKSAVARTPILAFILMFFALGYTVAHNKVVVVPLGADAGVSGREVVTMRNTNFSIPANATHSLSIRCPQGKESLGGGAGNSGRNFMLRENRPLVRLSNNFPSGWTATAQNIGSGSGANGITVYAICADVIN